VHIQSCIESSNNCDELNNIQSAADYYNSDLNPIQSGCCRPPTECGYTIVSPSNFDTSTGSNSSNPDCLTYSNNASIKCYNCQSCKGGAAQEIKRDGRILGIIFVVIFFVLVSDTSLLQSDIGIICSYHMLGHWLIWATTSGYFMVSQ
jgi:hypothetical protein